MIDQKKQLVFYTVEWQTPHHGRSKIIPFIPSTSATLFQCFVSISFVLLNMKETMSMRDALKL